MNIEFRLSKYEATGLWIIKLECIICVPFPQQGLRSELVLCLSILRHKWHNLHTTSVVKLHQWIYQPVTPRSTHQKGMYEKFSSLSRDHTKCTCDPDSTDRTVQHRRHKQVSKQVSYHTFPPFTTKILKFFLNAFSYLILHIIRYSFI